MVAPALAFALIGLSAMSSAMPTPQAIQDRQTLGPPTSSFGTPGSDLQPCVADVPEDEQPPCVWTGSGGDLSPSNKRQVVGTLPPDSSAAKNSAIDKAELRYLELLNQEDRNREEDREFGILYFLLVKVYHINIKAPPGVESTFHPGKRAEAAADCRKSTLKPLELEYEEYLKADELSWWERWYKNYLFNKLKDCGITIVKQPDGTYTTIVPETYVPGGAITPNPSTPGGSITPDPTTPGGSIKPSDKRGFIIPDVPIKGGKIIPDKPIKGGKIRPSDKRQTLVPDVPITGGGMAPSD